MRGECGEEAAHATIIATYRRRRKERPNDRVMGKGGCRENGWFRCNRRVGFLSGLYWPMLSRKVELEEGFLTPTHHWDLPPSSAPSISTAVKSPSPLPYEGLSAPRGHCTMHRQNARLAPTTFLKSWLTAHQGNARIAPTAFLKPWLTAHHGGLNHALCGLFVQWDATFLMLQRSWSSTFLVFTKHCVSVYVWWWCALVGASTL